jgi:oligopeptide/dipeptide ABC transporter ATP-binding protein
MTPLLQTAGAGVTYPRSERPALEGIDLEIRVGDTVGIVGESGSGKTTLGRLLVGTLEPTDGQVLVRGRTWASVRRRDPVRREVQMVFQDPYGALNPWMTARQAVAEVFRVWQAAGRREADGRAEEVLHEVGLTADALDRRPAQLSGGQCQRVGIARALAAEPSVLIADEPTSSLDVSVQAQILNLLTRLQSSRGLAIVLISHDLSVVSHVADRTLVLYAGRLVERGATSAVLTTPAHPYTRVLLDSIPGVDGDFRYAETGAVEGCVFAPRCPRMTDACTAAQPDAIVVGQSEVACIHPLVVPSRGPASDRPAVGGDRAERRREPDAS